MARSCFEHEIRFGFSICSNRPFPKIVRLILTSSPNLMLLYQTPTIPKATTVMRMGSIILSYIMTRVGMFVLIRKIQRVAVKWEANL